MLDVIFAVFECLGLVDDARSADAQRRRGAGLLVVAVVGALVAGAVLVVIFWLTA